MKDKQVFDVCTHKLLLLGCTIPNYKTRSSTIY